MLPPELQTSAQTSILCWLATVDADGQPNVSSKEIFKVLGSARSVGKQDADFATWAAPLQAMAGPLFPIHSVIVVRATGFEPILAPSYRLYPNEATEQAQVASSMRTYGVWPLSDAQ